MSLLPTVRLAVLTSLIGVLSWGCRHPEVNEYERVAKDWCLAIRASQVIPVYPPTEDLRPGDVFLVQQPTSQQVGEYKRRGFLSLDDHRTRIKELDFKLVYGDAYFKDPHGTTPHDRARLLAAASGDAPAAAGGSGGASAAGNSGSAAAGTEVAAPRVAFPTYTFDVKRGGGLSLALPIQGVPVAIGLMGADEARGTITISDAYSYAADTAELFQKVDTWARMPENGKLLIDAARNAGGVVFLRVVKRVYLTSKVDVQVSHASKVSGTGKAGLIQAAEDPTITVENFEQQAKKNELLLELLSKAAETAQVGASVRFNQATSRSVALEQRFDVPLVIGYVGMDIPVYETGKIGLPLPTFERLEFAREPPPPHTLGELSSDEEELKARTKALLLVAAEPGVQVEQVLGVIESAAATLPAEFNDIRTKAREARAETDPGRRADKVRALLKSFVQKINSYVSMDGHGGPRYAEVIDRLTKAMVQLNPGG